MKKELRKISIEKRKQLDCTFCSKNIIKKLFSLEEYKNAKNIVCYYPLKYEISDFDCLPDTTKTIFLPRVNGDILEICPYDRTQIKKGSYNIQEPQTNCIKTFENIDLIIIPCVAADKNGYRIGYGKGFYDRLLKEMPKKVIKIILTYSELLYDNIHPNTFDVKSDIIITEKAIYRI